MAVAVAAAKLVRPIRQYHVLVRQLSALMQQAARLSHHDLSNSSINHLHQRLPLQLIPLFSLNFNPGLRREPRNWLRRPLGNSLFPHPFLPRHLSDLPPNQLPRFQFLLPH